MGTKDTITKDYMADNRIFADVFNHMLYKGEKIIDPDALYPLDEYYGAAEPPVRCGESHLSGLTEPPHFVY